MARAKMATSVGVVVEGPHVSWHCDDERLVCAPLIPMFFLAALCWVLPQHRDLMVTDW